MKEFIKKLVSLKKTTILISRISMLGLAIMSLFDVYNKNYQNSSIALLIIIILLSLERIISSLEEH